MHEISGDEVVAGVLPRIRAADVIAIGPRDHHELAAADYPQPGGLTWEQLSQVTSAALASPGCAGWSVCICNPELDPGRQGADDIIGYLTKGIAHADGN